VRSLRSAATLLTDVADVAAFSRLLGALGFAEARPINANDFQNVGLAHLPITASVARGPGALRALVIAVTSDGPPIREIVSTVADRLARRAPHLLWLLGAVEPGGHHMALAAWFADRIPPRTAALVVDRRRVVDSDADTFCALEAVGAPAGSTTAFGAIGMACAALARRRSKRRRSAL